MHHRLVSAIEHAFGWEGPDKLGVEFAIGRLGDDLLHRQLLTPTTLLDMVMRRSLAFPQLRFVEGGEDVHPGRFLKNNTDRRGYSVPVADMRKVGRLLRSGCTLVLDTLDFIDPIMEVACRAFQWWSRELVQVNAYLTTQDASGFNLHWDDHDVIIVQLAGTKAWEVRGPSRHTPMFRDVEQNIEPSDTIVWNGVLKSGDALHIPWGYWHQATRDGHGEGYSLHVTFGFVKRTGVNWMTWLADRCRERDIFREDIDRWGSGTREAQEKQLLAEAVRLLSTYTPSDFLAAREREWESARHVATFGLFGIPDSVVCVTAFPPEITDRGDTVDVICSGKKLTFKRQALPALSLLLSGHPIHIEDHNSVPSIERVATILCEEEVCAELTAELARGYHDMTTGQTIQARVANEALPHEPHQ